MGQIISYSFKLLTLAFLWFDVCYEPFILKELTHSGRFLWFKSLHVRPNLFEIMLTSSLTVFVQLFKSFVENPSMQGELSKRGVNGQFSQKMNFMHHMNLFFMVSCLGPPTAIYLLADRTFSLLSLLLSRRLLKKQGIDYDQQLLKEVDLVKKAQEKYPDKIN